MIGVIQILNKRTDLFEKAGAPIGGKQAWKLTNQLLTEAPSQNGHAFEPEPIELE
jgi:hypothetical protein